MLVFSVTTIFCTYVFIVIGKETNKHDSRHQLKTGSKQRIMTDELNQSVIPEMREIRRHHTADEIQYIKTRILQSTQSQGRTALSRDGAFWEDGVVPYVLSDSYSERDREFILNAMNEFHIKTCIRFKAREDEMSYVLVEPGEGCFALIGRLENEINRVTLPEDCLQKGTIIHELMHALGFLHEQNRPDRDEFVRVMYDNIIEGKADNFDKFSFEDVNTAEQSYDYSSIMHYGPLEFSKDDRSPTIIPLQRGVVIGQRDNFSQKDILKINYLYQC